MLLKSNKQLETDIQEYALKIGLSLIGEGNVYSHIATKIDRPLKEVLEVIKGKEFFYLDTYFKLCEEFAPPFQFSIEYPVTNEVAEEEGIETLNEEIKLDIKWEEMLNDTRVWHAFFEISEVEGIEYYKFIDYDREDSEEDIKNYELFEIEKEPFQIFEGESWVKLPLKDISKIFDFQAKIML